MSPSSLSIQDLLKHLSRLERFQRRFLNRSLEPWGLNNVLARYLITIRNHPQTSQDFLAEFHGVDKSRVARAARELEDGGFILRTQDQQNRRLYQLTLTPKGQEAYDQISQISAQWGLSISQGIPEERLAAALEAIAQMAQKAAALSP